MTLPQKQTLEREIKLGVGRGFRLPHLPGESLAARAFTSTYYDTNEYRLAQAGVTLRYRREGRRGAWQLKIPHDEARQELEFAGVDSRPPAALTDLLFAYLRGHSLQPIARLRTRRTGFRVHGEAGPLADVVMDSVTAPDGQRVTHRLHELEVELIGGSKKDLAWIEKVLREAGARDGDQRPKVFRVLGLQFQAPLEQVPPAARPVEQFKAMLQREAMGLLHHDPGTRLGTDPEDLHQMRVATRRLRAYLRAAASMLNPDWMEALRAELAWLGGSLGLVRDLDVLLAYLAKESASFPLAERRAFQQVIIELQGERTEARGLMLEALKSERYLALLDRVEGAAQSPAVTDADVSLRDIAEGEYRKLRRAMRKCGPDPDDQTLHKIRIKGKRARYAVELAEASIGKPAARFIQQAKNLQDVLGEHQDAVVCEQRLHKLLRHSGGKSTALAFGRLIERQSERRRRMRAALPKVWSKLKRRADKIWG